MECRFYGFHLWCCSWKAAVIFASCYAHDGLKHNPSIRESMGKYCMLRAVWSQLIAGTAHGKSGRANAWDGLSLAFLIFWKKPSLICYFIRTQCSRTDPFCSEVSWILAEIIKKHQNLFNFLTGCCSLRPEHITWWGMGSAAYIHVSWALLVVFADKLMSNFIAVASHLRYQRMAWRSRSHEKGCKAAGSCWCYGLGPLEKTWCHYKTRHDTKIWGCESLSFARL